MRHNMKLNRDEFYSVKNGLKNIEVRINDNKRKKIENGDIVEFKNIEGGNEKVYVKVKNITKFDKFDDLYNYYEIERFGLYNHSKVELIDNIYKIYSRKEEELGVLAIEIELYIGEV